MKAADCLHAGIATHFVPAERVPAMEAALRRPGRAARARETVETVLSDFSDDPGAAPLAHHRDAIDRCFGGTSVEAIEDALGAEGGEWARATLAAMATKSPTSQKVALRQIRDGAGMEFEACMTMEYRLSQRAMAGPEFYEGVRAAVIDKDQAPRWRPASLAEVSDEDVAAWFAPLGADDLLFEDG